MQDLGQNPARLPLGQVAGSGESPATGTSPILIHKMSLSFRTFKALSILLLCGTAPAESLAAARVGNGLIALYDFRSSAGDLVKDQSGVGNPLNLKIAKPRAVKRSAGSLEISRGTIIQSDKPAVKIIRAAQKSGSLTIEAWIRPANLKQNGPARIITLSRNSNERNFTLGQDADKYEIRFRTKQTSKNGIPSTASPRRTVTSKLTHVVYTRARSGRTRIYLNGKQVAQGNVPDHLRKWNNQYRLALGDELSGGRPWLGTFHLVAVYGRDLTAREVTQNFRVGSKGKTDPIVAKAELSSGQKLFESKIAPLLADHCLECHDSATRKGKADLSRKSTAFASDFIVRGNASKSLIWELVDSDEMPAKRTPLTAAEKKLLKDWINGGAQWTTEVIDPSIHTRKQGAEQLWIQRLTIPEYITTVRSAVGVDISKEARELLPPDLRADGFSNTAYNLNVDLKHIGAYAKLADIIVDRMDVAKFTRRFNRSRKLIDKDNRALIESMGKWLLRGPLNDHEVVAYRGIATTSVAVGANFDETMGFIIEAMLQSPRFIYRVETQRGDGSAYPADEYELATRISYIIWGGPPDDELLRAADNGSLGDSAGIEEQVRRMLNDSRAVDRSQQFIAEWLNLGRLANMQPNRTKFPNWTPQLAVDMRRETLAYFKELVWNQRRPLAELLNGNFTYLTPLLAKHYGIPHQGTALQKVSLTGIRSRGGILTHGSILTIGGDEASMVTRGLFVMQDLLRGAIKDPPPGTNTTPPHTKEGLTQRGIAEQRIADANCGGCHIKFEPLAFGLEKYDGIGAFHDADEHGNKLREDGNILFPGTGKPIAYRTSAQLMDLLAGSSRVKECLTWKITQFALGRPLTAADAATVDNIHQTAQKNGGTYPAVITAIIGSELVQMTRTEVASK